MTVRIEAPPDKVRRLIELRSQIATRAATDPFGVLGYVPSERQAEFHAATEADVLYGGAAGGGKSVAIVMDGIKAAITHPHTRVLLLRRTYDELAESIFPVLASYDYARKLGASWNGSERQLTFPNSSLIRFRYMENLVDASRRQGGQYQLLLVDEATLMPPGVIDFIRYERIRSGRKDTPVLGVRMTCNPGGASHGEVKARYIDATDHGRNVVTDDNGLTVRFIQAKSSDNPHLDAGYARRLDAIPDPQRRAAMRDGDWDLFAGQVFAEWRYDRHTVDPIPLQASLPRYAGIDDGWTAPWAVAWFTVDGDGRIWVYRERCATQTTSAAQARIILEAEGAADRKYPVESVVHIADTSMWAGQNSGPTPAQVYAEAGVSLRQASKGPGSRLARKLLLHSLLADGPACSQHRAQGWEQCPKLHVFRNCTEIIRTLPALPYDPHRPEDVDSSADDHCLAGSTLIDTANGPRRIDSLIGTSGHVIGADGRMVRYFDVRLTQRRADVVRVVATDGSSIVLTPDHLVARADGWCPAGALRPGDHLHSPTMGAWTRSVSTPPLRSTEGDVSTSAATTSSATGNGYIGSSGPTSMARSPMGSTSTTSITTAPTTGLATSRSSVAGSTFLTTLPGLPSRSGRPAAPTRQSPVKATAGWLPNFAVKLPRRAGAAWRAALSYVSGAAGNGSVRSRSVRSTAQAPAHRPPIVLAVLPAGKADVYDLAVDDPSHAFSAAGFVVHNCYDALTYALFAATGGAQSLQLVRYDTDEPALGGGDGWQDFDSMTASY